MVTKRKQELKEDPRVMLTQCIIWKLRRMDIEMLRLVYGDITKRLEHEKTKSADYLKG